MTRIIHQKSKLLYLLIIILLASCVKNEVFFKYQPVNVNGWSKDSVYTFDVTIDDPSANYNFYVNTRNRGEYPYQNLWLFISEVRQDSTVTKDSINFYLADDYGKWLGSGVGPIYNMPVLYRQNFKFAKSGRYRYQIQHGMRDSMLVGINDIGLKIEKVE
ncbi:MAG: gliding motility lipoprotein GldH [Paludibacter sp.]